MEAGAITRALGSLYISACPLCVLPVPLVPDGRTIRRDTKAAPAGRDRHRGLHTGYQCHRVAQCRAAPCGAHARALPARRRRAEAALSRVELGVERLEDRS